MLSKTRSARFVLALLASTTTLGCGGPTAETLETRELDGPGGNETLTLEVWADNWFALSTATTSSGAALLAEDSVPFDTERSFNGERLSFSADLPLVLSFVVRDYLENDSGLEYIGSGRQQMGDGGFIFQVRDEAGQTLARSSAAKAPAPAVTCWVTVWDGSRRSGREDTTMWWSGRCWASQVCMRLETKRAPSWSTTEGSHAPPRAR